MRPHNHGNHKQRKEAGVFESKRKIGGDPHHGDRYEDRSQPRPAEETPQGGGSTPRYARSHTTQYYYIIFCNDKIIKLIIDEKPITKDGSGPLCARAAAVAGAAGRSSYCRNWSPAPCEWCDPAFARSFSAGNMQSSLYPPTVTVSATEEHSLAPEERCHRAAQGTGEHPQRLGPSSLRRFGQQPFGAMRQHPFRHCRRVSASARL